MSLRVVYRNWSADGTPHVHSFVADSWSIPADHSLIVRNGSDTVACIAAGEWMAVWRPDAVEGAAPPATAAPAAKAQKAAGGADATAAAPPAPAGS